jgi:hypothetical protein
MSGAVAGFGMTSQRTRTRMIERLREQGIADEEVLAAIAAVPRHVFVEEALASRAYEDTALPLGFSQTISQPYVVARMIEALRAGRRTRQDARDRRRLRLPGGGSGATDRRGLCGRADRAVARQGEGQPARDRQAPRFASSMPTASSVCRRRRPSTRSSSRRRRRACHRALLQQLAPRMAASSCRSGEGAATRADRTRPRGIGRKASRCRAFRSALVGSPMKDQAPLPALPIRLELAVLLAVLLVSGRLRRQGVGADRGSRRVPAKRQTAGPRPRARTAMSSSGRHAVFDRARSRAGLPGTGSVEQHRESEPDPGRSGAARPGPGAAPPPRASSCGRLPPARRSSSDRCGERCRRLANSVRQPRRRPAQAFAAGGQGALLGAGAGARAGAGSGAE